MTLRDKVSIFVLVVFITTFVYLISSEKRNSDNGLDSMSEDIIPYKSKVIIANGCGTSGIASKFRELLMKNGFIVYSPQNEDYWTYSESIVLSLDGNMDAARSVAEALKIDNCLMYKMEGSYESVKVIIGRDYKDILEKNEKK